MSDIPDTDPPEDDMETLAAEYVLGLLTVAQLPHVVALRSASTRFEQAVQLWEQRLLPLAEALEPVNPGARVWTGISRAIAPRQMRAGFWDSLNFWRGFSVATAAACAALVAGIFLYKPPATGPAAAALLASKTEGSFVATLEPAANGARLLIIPSRAVIPAGRSAELWLIAPGAKPAPLGLLEPDRPVAFLLSAGQIPADPRQTELAVSIEPPGGSPTGAATGPIIAAAKFQRL